MIKTITLCISILFIGIQSFSQKSNLIFFSEGGELFQVYLNGTLQNERPNNNLKIEDLPSSNYKARIVFADTAFRQTIKTIYLKEFTETTFNVRRKEETAVGNKFKSLGNSLSRDLNMKSAEKGPEELYVIRWFSDKALAVATENNVVVYQSTTPTTISTQQSSNANISTQATTTSTTVSTSTVAPTTYGDQVSVKANIAGMDFNMSVNDNMSDVESSSTVTTTQTVTTSGNVVIVDNTSATGCQPMSPSNFSSALNSVEAKDFEDTKKTMAKQIIDANCFSSSQIKQLLGVFDFEDSKLSIAKYAYDKTVDKNNYYQVNDAFQFDSSITDLNKYIAKKGK